MTTPSPRGRRHHHREDRHDRAGQLGRRSADADAGQLQRHRRLRDEPVRSAPRSPRRDVRRPAGDGDRADRARVSAPAANLWTANVGTETSGSVLSPSNQTMLAGVKPTARPNQSIRRHSDYRGPGHAGADGQVGHRCRDPPRRARGRARRQRSGDQPLHAAAQSRLHAVSARRRTEGRAHRHPARFFYEPLDATRSGCRAAGSIRHQAAAMAEAIAVLEARRRRHRRSRRHSQRRRSRSVEQLSRRGASARAPIRARGHDDGCSVVLRYGMKRDFNQVARDAGRVGPGQVAGRTEGVEHVRTALAGAIKYGQAALDISDEMDVERDRGTLRGRPREGPPAHGDPRPR